jgi:hypothetical protein
MTISLGARAAMLDGLDFYLETGASTVNFTLYQTNTALAVFPLTGMSAAVNDSFSLVSALVSSTGVEVAGTANRFVLTNQNGATAISGSVGAIGSGADIETPNLTVTAAATQTLNSLVVRLDAYGTLSVEASLTLQ